MNYFNDLNKVTNTLFYIIINALFLTTIISSMVASSYAVKNEKIDGKSIKCLRYVFNGYNGASEWVLNQSIEMQNDLDVWYANMLVKAYKNNGKVSNYYCLDVGASSLTFAILALIFFLLNVFLFSLSCFEIYIPIINNNFKY